MFDLLSDLPPWLSDAIGVLGFTLYMINYGLLIFHRLTSHATLYFVINFAAAVCVLISLSHAFNLASALIQIFWIAMSIVAVAVRLRGRMLAA